MSSVVVLPEALFKNTNKEEQKELADFFDKIVKSSSEAAIITVEEKFERRLTEEISKLDKKISETKADIIKWMFIFWAGQIGVLIAVLDLFFKR
jgi:hypothetical protein